MAGTTTSLYSAGSSAGVGTTRVGTSAVCAFDAGAQLF